MPDDHLGPEVAASCDESVAAIFDRPAIEPVVDVLSQLVGDGRALEFDHRDGEDRAADRFRDPVTSAGGTSIPLMLVAPARRPGSNRPWARVEGTVIPELDTERLRLRGLRFDDLDAYAHMYAEPDVMRFLEDGVPLGRDAAFRSMALHMGHWQLRGYGQWALEERVTGAFIGRAGLWQPEGWPGLEVGWILERSAWGRGYATEAGLAALGYASEVLAADEVISLIRPDNVGSIRVAERLGQSYQGDVRLMGKDACVYGKRLNRA